MDDFFGPALKGIVSSQPSLLAGSRRRVASRKPAVSTDESILLVRPEQLRLIPVVNRKEPDFCEVCGIGHGLFWTGKYVSCIDCARTLPKLRSMGIFIPERPKTPQEFLLWLATTHNNVMEVL